MVPTPKATSDVIIIHPLSLVRIANMAQIAVPAGTVEGIDAGDLDVTVQYP